MWNWRPLYRAPVLGWGLGLVAGGMEAVGLAATVPAAPTVVDGVLLGVLAVVAGGLLGALVGVVGGVFAETVLRKRHTPARHAGSMAFSAFFLSGWFLWAAAAFKLGQGLPVPAAALAATPIGVAGVVWFNAHYWLRREDIGDRRRLGWWFVSAVFGLVLGVGSGVSLGTQQPGSSRALDVDPTVVFITVHGLSPEEVGATRSDDAPSRTPRIDALAAEGVRFHRAVSPVPEVAPAHAALFTGRHPARVDVWSDAHVLSRAWPTLAEVVRKEGYATGAFVSEVGAGAHSGLSQGFAVYDDDLLPGVLPPSSDHIQLVGLLLDAWASTADLTDAHVLVSRDNAATVDRALAFVERVPDRPQLLWVQLGADDVGEIDAAVGRVVDAVQAAAGTRQVVYVVAGTRGRGAGVAHDNVRVPVVLVPRKMRVYAPDVTLTVRLMDVAATVLDQLGMKPFDQADGSDLSGFAAGTKTRGYATLLVAPTAPAVSGASPGLELGYLAGRKGDAGMVKLVAPVGRPARLHMLAEDPNEQVNLAEEQPEATAALEARARAETQDLSGGALPSSPLSAPLRRRIDHGRWP